MQEIVLNIIGRVATILAINIIVLPFVIADAEQINQRSYGQCVVISFIDDFTDELNGHLLVCIEDTGSTVSVSCNEIKNLLSLSSGEPQLHFGEMIKIKYRFDKHKYLEENWYWRGSTQTANYDSSDPTMYDFLANIVSADRLTFQVGDTRGVVNFEEETIDAVNDFKDRCY